MFELLCCRKMCRHFGIAYMGVTKHRTVSTGPKYSDILHWISSKSNKMQVRNAWKP